MHIAICDNEKKDLEILSNLVSMYATKNNKDISLSVFDSASKLLYSIEDGSYYSLILFDILMPELNGIEAAKIIRKLGIDTQIVFITISRDFALDAFAVKANNYLLKPINEKTLFPILEELELSDSQGVVIETKEGLKKITPNKLLYGEVRGHTVFWHFTTGAIIESRGSITNALNTIADYGAFLRIHRSFFINIALVTEISQKELCVILKGNKRLNIPRAKYAKIHEAYINYERGGVINEK